jgi:hypothetical protein
MTQEIKAWFIIFVSVAFLTLIYLSALLGTYLRPGRWSNGALTVPSSFRRIGIWMKAM